MTDNGIVWEDPPGGSGGANRGKWVGRLLPLVEQPERWARIAVFDDRAHAYQAAANLSGRKVRVPPGRWEFVSRSVEHQGFVYARYLGPKDGGS